MYLINKSQGALCCMKIGKLFFSYSCCCHFFLCVCIRETQVVEGFHETQRIAKNKRGNEYKCCANNKDKQVSLAYGSNQVQKGFLLAFY